MGHAGDKGNIMLHPEEALFLLDSVRILIKYILIILYSMSGKQKKNVRHNYYPGITNFPPKFLISVK